MSAALVAAPLLLCFNLRLEHLAGARDTDTQRALSNAASMLGRARAQAWRVLHVHTRRPRETAMPHGAIAGLEPFADEPVFTVLSASAFSESRLIESARAARPARLNLIGALYSRAGLATVLAAQELGTPLNFFSEACFSPGFDAIAPRRVLDLVRLDLKAMMRVVSDWPDQAEENVICLESWRT